MSLLHRIYSLYRHHKEHLLTAVFLFGFIVDIFALPSVLNPLYIQLGFIYIGCILLFLFLRERFGFILASLGLSFSLGGFLSYVFVYYMRSGDLYVSWPLLLYLFIIIFINEFGRFKDKTKTIIDCFLFFTAFTFFVIYNAPIFLGEVSDGVFLKSIIISLVLLLPMAFLITFIATNKTLKVPLIALSIGVPLMIASLYFVEIIPAAPLTTRDMGLYAQVSRDTRGEYYFVETPRPDRSPVNKATEVVRDFFVTLRFKNERIYMNEGEPLYFFTAVLAPAAVSSQITHVWQIYDTQIDDWRQVSRVSYPVVGGRLEGYRGYSFLNSTKEGLYRVQVKVGNRLVGEKRFEITSLPGL